MRIMMFADLHGWLPDTSGWDAFQPDLILFAGDIGGTRDFVDGPFREWLTKLPAEPEDIIGIAGNHDFIAEEDPDFMRALPWVYLQDETIEYHGLVVHGSPWTPAFFDWAFMLDDEDLEQYFSLIPDETNILITHGPPRGYGDWTHRGVLAGSITLRKQYDRLKSLKLHTFGHIHENGGVWQHNGAHIINCTLMGNRGLDIVGQPRLLVLNA